MRRRITTAAALLLALSAPARGAFITNGSFEAVPGSGPGFEGEGILPTGWQVVSITPDTYSVDGSYGLFPGAFANFSGVTAFDGIRWVAGGAFGRTATDRSAGFPSESFGNTLTSALTPGQEYRLDARLYQALRPDLDNPGGYHLFLATGNTPAGVLGATFLGALDPTTGVDAWEARSLTFVAPADAASRPFLSFSPYQTTAGNAYPGLDGVSLNLVGATAVPEPASVVLFGVGSLGLLAARVGRPGRAAVARA